MSEPAEMALYATRGRRREQHVVVLYLRVNKDWTSRQLRRNGNDGPSLARCPMTPEAEAYCAESKRASSLQYSGRGTATLQGLADDLRSFGVAEETVARFVGAARAEGLIDGGDTERPDEQETAGAVPHRALPARREGR